MDIIEEILMLSRIQDVKLLNNQLVVILNQMVQKLRLIVVKNK
jgi:hypothetical protein